MAGSEPPVKKSHDKQPDEGHYIDLQSYFFDAEPEDEKIESHGSRGDPGASRKELTERMGSMGQKRRHRLSEHSAAYHSGQSEKNPESGGSVMQQAWIPFLFEVY